MKFFIYKSLDISILDNPALLNSRKVDLNRYNGKQILILMREEKRSLFYLVMLTKKPLNEVGPNCAHVHRGIQKSCCYRFSLFPAFVMGYTGLLCQSCLDERLYWVAASHRYLWCPVTDFNISPSYWLFANLFRLCKLQVLWGFSFSARLSSALFVCLRNSDCVGRGTESVGMSNSYVLVSVHYRSRRSLIFNHPPCFPREDIRACVWSD